MSSQTVQTATTSTSLIFRIQQNDQDAWSRLEFLYRKLIFYWCEKQKVPANDWEDISQAVFQIVHRYIGDFVRIKDKACFRPWLWSITITRIAEFRKGNKNFPSLLADTDIDLVKKSWVMPPPLPGTKMEDEAEKQIAFNQALEMLRASIGTQT